MGKTKDIEDWIKTRLAFNDVIIKYMNLDFSVTGYCHKSPNGIIYIIINARHSKTVQEKAFWHEVHHAYVLDTKDIAINDIECVRLLEWEADNFMRRKIKQKGRLNID